VTPTTRPDETTATVLDPDLSALIGMVGSRLVDASVITTLPSPRENRATFRLRFADGRILKGRRLARAEEAVRVAALRPRLATASLTEVVAVRGAALLEEWRDGVPMADRPVDSALLRRCGEILGAIHRAPISETERDQARHYTAEALASADRHVGELIEVGALVHDEGRGLARLLRAYAPRRPEIGIVHRDFCAENVVIDGTDRPWVIDNTGLAIGALDEDLGRSSWRWPMTAPERAAFYTGYRRFRDPLGFLAHAPFWRIVASLRSAAFRHRAQTARPGEALEQLRRWLAERGLGSLVD